MTDRSEKHARLDKLSADLEAANAILVVAHGKWVVAAENVKNIEREARNIWLSLFDDVAAGR